MDEQKLIEISDDEIEIIETKDYKAEVDEHFRKIPDIARPLMSDAKQTIRKIEQMLYSTPSFINAVKTTIPDATLQAVLTDDQKSQLAKGALKLMTKKDGSIMANLVNPETKKIVSTIPLKEVQMTTEMSQAMMNLSMQMQMAQIAEQIQEVQIAVEEVRKGQEYDRLAIAYSCQQKLLQAMAIKNPNLRSMALMQLVSSAEDSRNLLMLSQKANVKFIVDQPENIIGKLVRGAKTEKINLRINEISESFCAVNMVSFTEAMAYQEMGEYQAARQSLSYFADFINDTYLAVPGLVERLDSIDPSTKKYWSQTLPGIKEKINMLPGVESQILIGGFDDDKG